MTARFSSSSSCLQPSTGWMTIVNGVLGAPSAAPASSGALEAPLPLVPLALGELHTCFFAGGPSCLTVNDNGLASFYWSMSSSTMPWLTQ